MISILQEEGFLNYDNTILSSLLINKVRYAPEPEKRKHIILDVEYLEQIHNIKNFKRFLTKKDILEFKDFYLNNQNELIYSGLTLNKIMISKINYIVFLYNNNIKVIIQEEYLKKIFRCYNIKDIKQILFYCNLKNNVYPLEFKINEDWFIIAPYYFNQEIINNINIKEV